MTIFPVCIVAEMPLSIIESFLTNALAGANDLVPDTDPCLAIITEANTRPSQPSQPPLEPFTSPFLGKSVEQVADKITYATYFAVLDERSAEDNTAILASRNDQGVETVRVTFGSAQSLLTSFGVASIGFGEVQSIAASKGGVYGETGSNVRKGGPAPRKKLGA